MILENKILLGAVVVISIFVGYYLSIYALPVFWALIIFDQLMLRIKIWQWIKIVWPIIISTFLFLILYPGIAWLNQIIFQTSLGDNEGTYLLIIFTNLLVLLVFFTLTVHLILLWMFGRRNKKLKDVIVRTLLAYLATVGLVAILYIYDFPVY